MPADACDRGGCLFRLPPEGGRAIWQITNRCNYRCRYCMFGSGEIGRAPELTAGEALRALDQLREWGCRALKITGGEPFSRPDIMDVVDRACSFGWEVDVSTNAALITAGRARILAASKLKMVHVSLDGHTAALHDAARGEGAFRATLRGLAELLHAGVRVRIGCVIFRGNQEYLEEMVAFCAGLGAPEVVFSLMRPAGRVHAGSALLSTHSAAALAAEIDVLAGRHGAAIKVSHNLCPSGCAVCSAACPGGLRFLFIDHLGRVAPCTWVVERAPEHRSALSLRQHSLREILASTPLTTYRRSCSKMPPLEAQW